MGFHRFIPARAGNIKDCPTLSNDQPVHPRTCGEHRLTVSCFQRSNGSSPHVRGTFPCRALLPGGIRFIPARAGNIRRNNTSTDAGTVHPRTCGEHICKNRKDNVLSGSSPHVRGTFYQYFASDRQVRFIPARAGNMRIRCLTVGARSVHPRTCGEHTWRELAKWHKVGSSPHVRGTWGCEGNDRRKLRFIPARAGNILPLLPRNHGSISRASHLPSKRRIKPIPLRYRIRII